jgi:iron complex outermembrane recepter protein
LLRVNFNAAYIDAIFVDYPNAPCWGNGVIQTAALGCASDLAVDPTGATKIQNVSGKTMPDSPKFKATLSAEQRIPLGAATPIAPAPSSSRIKIPKPSRVHSDYWI